LQPPPEAQTQVTNLHHAQARTHEQGEVSFSLRMQYRGEERTTEIPLTQDMMGQLALEAGLRDIKIGQLVSEVIIGVIRGDLFQGVLDRTSEGSARTDIRARVLADVEDDRRQEEQRGSAQHASSA